MHYDISVARCVARRNSIPIAQRSVYGAFCSIPHKTAVMPYASPPFLYRRSIYIPDRKLFKPLFTGQGTRTRRHASIAVLRQHEPSAVSPENIRPRGGEAFFDKSRRHTQGITAVLVSAGSGIFRSHWKINETAPERAGSAQEKGQRGISAWASADRILQSAVSQALQARPALIGGRREPEDIRPPVRHR